MDAWGAGGGGGGAGRAGDGRRRDRSRVGVEGGRRPGVATGQTPRAIRAMSKRSDLPIWCATRKPSSSSTSSVTVIESSSSSVTGGARAGGGHQPPAWLAGGALSNIQANRRGQRATNGARTVVLQRVVGVQVRERDEQESPELRHGQGQPHLGDEQRDGVGNKAFGKVWQTGPPPQSQSAAAPPTEWLRTSLSSTNFTRVTSVIVGNGWTWSFL